MDDTLPTTIALGAHEITVFGDAMTSSHLRDLGQRGQSQLSELIIRLNAERARSMVQETLLHELCHYILDGSALREHFADEVDEAIVTVMANGVLELLRRNPELVAYLTS